MKKFIGIAALASLILFGGMRVTAARSSGPNASNIQRGWGCPWMSGGSGAGPGGRNCPWSAGSSYRGRPGICLSNGQGARMNGMQGRWRGGSGGSRAGAPAGPAGQPQ